MEALVRMTALEIACWVRREKPSHNAPIFPKAHMVSATWPGLISATALGTALKRLLLLLALLLALRMEEESGALMPRRANPSRDSASSPPDITRDQ